MEKPRRGRPPKYIREDALENALQTFWSRGYSATTLDHLAESMGMNRPSIYGAFGDKEALYRASLEHFIAKMHESLSAEVSNEPDLRVALERLYEGALAVYFTKGPSRGCFVFCTAPAEAMELPLVQDILGRLLKELDALLTMRFREAQASAAFPAEQDAALAAKLAQAVLHSLALRARAGESRASLRRMAKAAVHWLADGRLPPHA
jgi:AcrR family transcriptional regulator